MDRDGSIGGSLAYDAEVRRAHVLGSVAAVVAALASHDARADVPEGVVVALGILGVTFGLGDIAFVAYDGVQAYDGVEPSEGVMIAQALVTGPQIAAGATLMAFGQIEVEDNWPITLVTIVPATFVNGLFIFSAWSADGSSIPVAPRLGVSMMIGADLTLTMGAVFSAIVKPHYAALALAVPEMLIGTAQAIPSFVQAARDPGHFAGWFALGSWSAALSVHGALSAAAYASGIGRPKYESATPRKPGELPTWTFAPAMLKAPWSTGSEPGAPGVVVGGRF